MVLEEPIARYGVPEHLRSDNGPEFIAYAIVEWPAQQKIKTIYITPAASSRRLKRREHGPQGRIFLAWK